METSIKLDDQLLNEAKQLSHIENTEELVQKALERYVTILQNNQQLLALRGKVEFWDDEDINSDSLD
ncbi:type II toxin-antitoxin system VapB family antitoxin [Spirosoma fluviale]|uniref:Antitoxin of type II TA system, VapB n=1 Tax=Spirosoma fluviale TaxID=1597977 RepID=A0A286F7W2_9BACT|nr:type II toxin-antitoxin system VapB family antitoxin [Spirosoma fluviale]SOD79317.1 antitoxin of type II TA system, VapB [Spirosoma fluviale]